MQKIKIKGHGGHLCEAWLNETVIMEIGDSIENAIGKLIKNHPECGFELEISPCSTTAYTTSGISLPGEVKCPKCNSIRYNSDYPCYKCGSYEDADNNFILKQSEECKVNQRKIKKKLH
jgi:hypothetical protein